MIWTARALFSSKSVKCCGNGRRREPALIQQPSPTYEFAQDSIGRSNIAKAIFGHAALLSCAKGCLSDLSGVLKSSVRCGNFYSGGNPWNIARRRYLMNKIIAALLAGVTLLAGINLAAAQALPTNPPTPSEGGALPPSGD
jgi:hypothetical protein